VVRGAILQHVASWGDRNPHEQYGSPLKQTVKYGNRSTQSLLFLDDLASFFVWGPLLSRRNDGGAVVAYRLIPNFARPHTVSTYSAIVSKQFAPKLVQKPTPALSIAGKARNIGSDGRTYQKVDWAWSAIRAISLVSRHSQRIPSKDTRGSETISAPSDGLRFATSETTAMINPDDRHLTAK
jgi:hypothetical protein